MEEHQHCSIELPKWMEDKKNLAMDMTQTDSKKCLNCLLGYRIIFGYRQLDIDICLYMLV